MSSDEKDAPSPTPEGELATETETETAAENAEMAEAEEVAKKLPEVPNSELKPETRSQPDDCQPPEKKQKQNK